MATAKILFFDQSIAPLMTDLVRMREELEQEGESLNSELVRLHRKQKDAEAVFNKNVSQWED